MAPSLRVIRQAAMRKRKIEGAPAERKAVAKVAKRTEAKRVEAMDPSGSHEAAASGARKVESSKEAERREAGEGDLPPSPTPAPPSPPVVLIELSSERGVEVEPVHPTTEPEKIPLPLRERTTEASLPAKAPEEAESAASPATTKSADGEGADPSFQSILTRYSRWAERTLDAASAPELQGYLRQQGRVKFFREASVAHLWVSADLSSISILHFRLTLVLFQALNSMTAMKGLWAQAEAALDQSSEEMGALRSKAERAEMLLEDTRASTARAFEAEIKALRHRAGKAEDALEVAQRQAANELDNATVAEEKLLAAESEVHALKAQLLSAGIEISMAEERAKNAEENARLSVAKIATSLAEANKRTTEVEKKMAEATQKLSDAERRATEAVEEFRRSAAFDRELAESTAFAYDGGFQDCKVKIQKLYGLEGIEGLEPDEVSEDDDSAPHNL